MTSAAGNFLAAFGAILFALGVATLSVWLVEPQATAFDLASSLVELFLSGVLFVAAIKASPASPKLSAFQGIIIATPGLLLCAAVAFLWQ
jgi:hypothetical protein